VKKYRCIDQLQSLFDRYDEDIFLIVKSAGIERYVKLHGAAWIGFYHWGICHV